MLAVSEDVRLQGAGAALVQAAEDCCRAAGCDTMRLELLTPREWEHPTKAMLKRWYMRIGLRGRRGGGRGAAGPGPCHPQRSSGTRRRSTGEHLTWCAGGAAT